MEMKKGGRLSGIFVLNVKTLAFLRPIGIPCLGNPKTRTVLKTDLQNRVAHSLILTQ